LAVTRAIGLSNLPDRSAAVAEFNGAAFWVPGQPVIGY